MSASGRVRNHGQEGSALVMALVFLTSCGIIIGALMTFANTNSAATTSLRTSRGSDFDAQAAMEAAIATVRTGSTCGTGASGYTPSWTLNNPSRPLRVDCFSLSSSATQRNDVLAVCPSSVNAPCPDNSAIVRANVIFYDKLGTGNSVGIQTWSNQ
jgi:hypothetical protein